MLVIPLISLQIIADEWAGHHSKVEQQGLRGHVVLRLSLRTGRQLTPGHSPQIEPLSGSLLLPSPFRIIHDLLEARRYGPVGSRPLFLLGHRFFGGASKENNGRGFD